MLLLFHLGRTQVLLILSLRGQSAVASTPAFSLLFVLLFVFLSLTLSFLHPPNTPFFLRGEAEGQKQGNTIFTKVYLISGAGENPLTKYLALIQSALKKKGHSRNGEHSLFLQLIKFQVKDKTYILRHSTHIPP